MKRIGIYGGTYSPPHIGHTSSAEAFICAYKPDKLLIIPDNIPPHKLEFGEVEAHHRLNMARLAFSGLEGCEVSDYELTRGGKSYTVHTLEHFAEADTQLCFLLGTDMFLTLDRWYRAPDIMRLAEIALVRREDSDTERIYAKKREYERLYGAVVHIIDAEIHEISSTELREKLLCGEDVSHLISAEVCDYIKTNGLYKNGKKG